MPSALGVNVRRAAMFIAVELAACSSPVAPDRDTAAPVQTEWLSYAATREKQSRAGKSWWYVSLNINITFRNIAGRTLYFDRCNYIGFELQRFVANRWEKFPWTGWDFYCQRPTIVVQPDEEYEGVLALQGVEPNSHDVSAQFGEPLRDGLYRVILSSAAFQPNSEDAGTIDPSLLYSNTFAVVVD